MYILRGAKTAAFIWLSLAIFPCTAQADIILPQTVISLSGNTTAAITGNSPAVSVSAADAGRGYYYTATAAETYYFSVIGPATTTPVPIIFSESVTSYAYTSDQVYNVFASAVASFNGPSSNITYAESCYSLHNCYGGDFPPYESAATISETIAANTVYSVYLDGEVDLQLTPQSGNAYASGTISIDPNFLISHPDYSIVFSNTNGPTTVAIAVVEPCSLALFASGLAALLFFVGNGDSVRPWRRTTNRARS